MFCPKNGKYKGKDAKRFLVKKMDLKAIAQVTTAMERLRYFSSNSALLLNYLFCN